MKRNESEAHNVLNALRLQYETQTGTNLNVKFVGRIAPDTLADVVSDLVALDLPSKPPDYHAVIEKRPGLEAGLKLFVRKSLHSDWYSVNDRVGWVTRNPESIIATEIEKKSKKLRNTKPLRGTIFVSCSSPIELRTAERSLLNRRGCLNFMALQPFTYFPIQKTPLLFARQADGRFRGSDDR